MKKTIKVVSILILVLMCLSSFFILCGCDESNNNSSNNNAFTFTKEDLIGTWTCEGQGKLKFEEDFVLLLPNQDMEWDYTYDENTKTITLTCLGISNTFVYKVKNATTIEGGAPGMKTYTFHKN